MNSSSFFILTLQLVLLVVLSSSRTLAIPYPNDDYGGGRSAEEETTEAAISSEEARRAEITDEPPLSTQLPPIIPTTSSELSSDDSQDSNSSSAITSGSIGTTEVPATSEEQTQPGSSPQPPISTNSDDVTLAPLDSSPASSPSSTGFPQEDGDSTVDYTGGRSEEEETPGGQVSSEEQSSSSSVDSKRSQFPPTNPHYDHITDKDDYSSDHDSDNSEEFRPSPTSRPTSRVVPVSRSVSTNGDIPPFQPLGSSRSRPSNSRQSPRPIFTPPHTPTSQLRAIPSIPPPRYHPDTPTNLIVQFAQVRRDVNARVKTMNGRVTEIDDRVTDLVKGNLTDISAVRKANTESIGNEIGNRRNALKRLQRHTYDWVEGAKNEVEEVHDNLDLTRQSVNYNRAHQINELTIYDTQTKHNIEMLTRELERLHALIKDLQHIAKKN